MPHLTRAAEIITISISRAPGRALDEELGKLEATFVNPGSNFRLDREELIGMGFESRA